jgi:hypothetical protein
MQSFAQSFAFSPQFKAIDIQLNTYDVCKITKTT